MIFAWLTFRGIPSSTRVSMSGLNLWASTAASIASFQSSTVISSGTSWPLLEYSRKALPTSLRVSIERKTSPQGQWKKRGILPSVLPCVPLPLPGAPKRTNVLYFIGGTFFYKTNSEFGQCLQRHLELSYSDRETSSHNRRASPPGRRYFAATGSTFTRRPARSKRTF